MLGVPCGWLADRWSRVGTIILGLVIWTIATAACGLAGSFSGLLAARMLVGAGEAALAPAAYAIIHQSFPRHMTNRALSLFQVGAVIGAGTAFYLVGGIYDHLKAIGTQVWPLFGTLAPWQATFVVVALPGAVLVPILWWVLARNERLNAGTIKPVASVAASSESATAYLVRDKAFIFALFIGMAGLLTMNYAMLSWVPTIFNREFGWTPGQIGKPYGLVVLVASSVGMLVAAWIADRMQRRANERIGMRVPMVAGIFALPLALALAFVGTPHALLACIALLHGLCTSCIGIAPALLQHRTPAEIRSRISAVYVMTVNICGLAIGPLVVGNLAAWIGTAHESLRQAVAGAGGAALVISILAFASFAFSRRRDPA